MSGKTALVFGGVMLAVYPGLEEFTTRVGLSNAIAMALGQCWYSHYWRIGPGEGIDDFTIASDHRDHRTSQHALLKCCSLPALWTFAAALYYAAFIFLFDAVRQNEENALAVAYATAAEFWHGGCLVLLVWTSFLLTQVPHSYTVVPSDQQDGQDGLKEGDGVDGTDTASPSSLPPFSRCRNALMP